MFSINQKVILTESHNNLEGVVVVVPKQMRVQSGLTQQLGRVKVSYMSGIGMTEAWFKNEVLGEWIEPKDITASLKAIHQLELEKIAKENEREKLSWIVNKGSSKDTKVDVEKMKAKLEDEEIIEKNLQLYRKQYGDRIPVHLHPDIRSAEACYTSTAKAVELANHYNTRLHILHLSTAGELELLEGRPYSKNKLITGEVCVHHLWFDDSDYKSLGTRIKWNPAIKTRKDREALLDAVRTDRIDIIATDHAPHTWEEKNKDYIHAASGGPMVQHSLPAMLELYHRNLIDLETIVEKMCHAPARLFEIVKRGFIRKGYWSDLVIIDPDNPWTVSPDNILYKCGLSPFEDQQFRYSIEKTFVNGQPVFDKGIINENIRGKVICIDNSSIIICK